MPPFRLRTYYSQPEDDGSGDGDGLEGSTGAPVVADVDAPPALEFAEHVLDAVAVAVDSPVMRDREERHAMVDTDDRTLELLVYPADVKDLNGAVPPLKLAMVGAYMWILPTPKAHSFWPC